MIQPQSTRRPIMIGVRVVVWLCLAAVAAFALNAWREARTADADRNAGAESTMRAMGLIDPALKRLDPRFTDNQGRLVADAPASHDQWVDPQTIVVAHISASKNDRVVSWSDFNEYLAKTTGRKVEERVYDNTPEQLKQIADGQITIVALHAAETPYLVNHYGYQPIAVSGSEAGIDGHRLNLIVPADSAIASPRDLAGRTLVCSAPTSITGYRAAVVLLLKNEKLRPNVDYAITWAPDQKPASAILGVARGILMRARGATTNPTHTQADGKGDGTLRSNDRYEAATVSNDKLHSMVDKRQVSPSEFKVIYESSVIPRTTIGYFYNLKPDLAAKISQATLSYRPASGALRFLPTDYKKDFELVRLIDGSFAPRLNSTSRTED